MVIHYPDYQAGDSAGERKFLLPLVADYSDYESMEPSEVKAMAQARPEVQWLATTSTTHKLRFTETGEWGLCVVIEIEDAARAALFKLSFVGT